jgi:hypothetical protein
VDLAQKLRITKIQFAKHMNLKKKEEQSVDTPILLRRGNKIPMEGVTETKFGAETEGTTIQSLPHLRIHPINNHQILTLGRCQQEPADSSLICCLLLGSASAWQIQKWMLTVRYWMDHRAPNGRARESTQGAKGICNHIGGTTI